MSNNNLEDDIDVVESGYEFLLAYAAQGRPPHDEANSAPPHARPTVENMLAAMTRIKEGFANSSDELEQVIVSDLSKANAALKFVLGQSRMSSELIDNLNASIHLRAVLTDFFLYSEKFRPELETN
jgi:hypothetical protein